MQLDQAQTQKQILKFSPLQIQLLNLLQLNSLAIEQRIKDEIEENPALEEGKEDESEEDNTLSEEQDEYDSDKDADDDFNIEDYMGDENLYDYKTYSSNNSKDDDVFQPLISQSTTFQIQLKEQLQSFRLNNNDYKIAKYLVDSLDEDGYLHIPVSKICDDLSFSENKIIEEDKIESVLKFIQQCDPAGVGARSLKECLLLQLERKKTNVDLALKAINVISNFFNEFSNKNFAKIMRETLYSQQTMQEIITLITHLNPKPVFTPGRDDVMAITIIPEFQVLEENGKLEVVLCNSQLPELKINKNFAGLMGQFNDELKSKRKKVDKSAVHYVKQKIDSARWFINAIQQRQMSMLKTMEAIVKIQREYFLTGDIKKLRPMILKDVANIINLDISTVSRVTSTKYVQTSFGIIRLKNLFTSIILKEGGEEVSNKEIQKIISELILLEDKSCPLTDLELTGQLKVKGFNTARRTIAKYRDLMGIPTSRLRKQLI